MPGCFFCFPGNGKISTSDVYDIQSKLDHDVAEQEAKMERENVESTERSKKLVQGMIDSGSKDRAKIRKQHKQVDRINQKVDNIGTDLEHIDRDVKDSRSIGWTIWHKITPCCGPGKKTVIDDSSDEEEEPTPMQVDSGKGGDTDRDKTNNNLQDIRDGVGELKTIATDINKDLREGNKDLNKLDKNLDKVGGEIKHQDGEVTRAREESRKGSCFSLRRLVF